MKHRPLWPGFAFLGACALICAALIAVGERDIAAVFAAAGMFGCAAINTRNKLP